MKIFVLKTICKGSQYAVISCVNGNCYDEDGDDDQDYENDVNYSPTHRVCIDCPESTNYAWLVDSRRKVIIDPPI